MRDIFKFKSKRRVFFVLVVFTFLFSPKVEAVTISSNSSSDSSCYYFDRTTGKYSASQKSGWGRDCLKKHSSNPVYCVQWKLEFGGTTGYTLDAKWNSDSKNAVIAGMMIDSAQKAYSNEKEAYHMASALLNTFFNKVVKSSSSMNFYSTNSTIKKMYDQVLKDYEKVVLSKKIAKPTFKVTDSVLNYSSGTTYISDKITLSGIKEYVGDNSDKVSYVISLSTTKGQAEICTSANGTNCKNTVTFSGRKSDYPFYVKATGADANTVITINVKGSNDSSYSSSIRYSYGSNKQDLLEKKKIKVERSTRRSVQLTVPNINNHRIVGYKVDEDGELVTGASLEIYRDNPNVAGNLLASNQGGSSMVSYTSPTVATSDDDFFKHSYYLVEKSAPDGYALTSDNIQKNIYVYDPNVNPNQNSEKCYYEVNGSTQEADLERCNFSAYEYKCQASTGGEPVDLSENENCDFTPKTPETSEGENTSDTTTDSGTDGSTNPTNPSTPTVTYEKICYNKNTKTKVDETYCSEKDKYVKVSKSSGNLAITKVNVKNSVKISKQSITGSDEVVGASLKICSSASYQEKKENCDPAKTISDVEMSWTSGSTPVEFVGLKKGDYYIVETTSPRGYVIATTATPFSIDSTGEVKSGNQTVKDNLIVIKNKLNNLKISKTDIATGKELPGATISICNTYTDENGKVKLLTDQYNNDCVPAILSDGTEATWTSTDKEKEISGLTAGTYYLVEKIAPKNYSTAESILFTMTADGKLMDKDGKSLANNKIVMSDKKIEDVKTGMEQIYKVASILIVAMLLGFGSYYFLVPKNSANVFTKVRKRKIHK